MIEDYKNRDKIGCKGWWRAGC